jgi:hypothetical protein
MSRDKHIVVKIFSCTLEKEKDITDASSQHVCQDIYHSIR